MKKQIFSVIFLLGLSGITSLFALPIQGICAHRGDSACYPENTVDAFQAAVRKGAAMIELDVQACKTGELVIMHDDTVDRTTDGTGAIADLTFDEIRALDAGSWKAAEFAGIRVPTLQESLDAIPAASNIWINVHCRDNVAASVAKVIREKGRLRDAFIACGSSAIKTARSTEPKIKSCNLTLPSTWGDVALTNYMTQSVNLNAEFVQLQPGTGVFQPDQVKEFHQHGGKVNLFYINDASQLEAALARGVDFPLTDKLDDLLAKYRSLSKKPTLANVTVSQDERTRVVTVNFTTVNAPSIVTVQVEGMAGPSSVWGDVGKVISVGSHQLQFLADGTINAAKVKLVIWRTDSPPPYLVLDIQSLGHYFYVPSEDALPDGGLKNDIYKKSRIVLRRIPAKNQTFLMGSPVSEKGHDTNYGYEGWNDGSTFKGAQVPVKFTHDYYIGIYPVTQRQWEMIFTYTRPSNYRAEPWYEIRPVEQVTFSQIRGTTDPTNHDTRDGSFLKALRNRLGGDMAFDLPTEAQWEFACRAGSTSAFYTGDNLSDEGWNKYEFFDKIGRYNFNGGKINGNDYYSWNVDTNYASSVVGSYPANGFGLYDMLGNVWEFCLDWCESGTYYPGPDSSGYSVDPTGKATGSCKALRGGSYGSNARFCRSAGLRHNADVNNRHCTWGFRVVLNIP